jgi:hypothetical protein
VQQKEKKKKKKKKKEKSLKTRHLKPGHFLGSQKKGLAQRPHPTKTRTKKKKKKTMKMVGKVSSLY